VPIYVQHGADVEIKGKIPDKEAALVILHDLLGKEPYIPRPPTRPRPVVGMSAAPAAAPPREVKPLPESVELRIRKRVSGLRKK
jgi:hypothetical protein